MAKRTVVTSPLRPSCWRPFLLLTGLLLLSFVQSSSSTTTSTSTHYFVEDTDAGNDPSPKINKKEEIIERSYLEGTEKTILTNKHQQQEHLDQYDSSASIHRSLDSVQNISSTGAVVSDQIILKKKARLRQYLKSLRNKQTKRVILGQQGNHNDTDLSSSYATGFDFVYDELAALFDNERHVGFIGVDIGELGYSPPNLALQDILRFGLSGHIVTAMFHPRNPWTGGDSWDLSDVNVPDILPNGSRRSQWLAYLNTIADVLQEASNQGIIILIRYLQEMNGYWFWWCNLSKAHYKALYRDVHKHFTKRRGLKNLLFVYSPGNAYSNEIKPYAFYFPGKKFVDMIGVTVYEDCYQGDPLEIYEYSSLVSLAGNKPLFIAELGPQTEDTLFWYWDYADGFALYPEVVMAMAYNDWSYEGDGNWVMKSIRGNHPDGVLWHDTVIVKEELPASLFANSL